MFDAIPSLGDSGIGAAYLLLNYESVDPLWLLLNSTCKIFCNDFWLVKLVTAIFVNTTIFWFCKKHSPAPFLTICFFYIFQFWNFNYEILRESISVSFFLIALDGIIDGRNKLIRYYILVIPSLFFHSFGIITIFLPFIKYLKIDKNLTKYILILLIITPLLMSISGYLMQFDIWGDNLTRKMEEKYLAGDNSYGTGILNIFGIIQQSIIVCCAIYIVKHSKISNEIQKYGYAFSFILLMIMGFAILYRVNNYFCLPFYICLSSYVLNALKKKKEKILIVLIFMFFMLEPKFSYNVYRRYTPYSSIFTKEINMQREAIFNEF